MAGQKFTVRKVLSNSAILGGSEVFSRAISIVLIMVVARKLGPESMGLYALGVAVSRVLKVVTNFGLSRFVAREIGRHPEKAGSLAAEVTLLKCMVFGAQIPFVYLFIMLTVETAEKQTVIWLFSISSFLLSQLETVFSFFRANLRAGMEGISVLSLRTINMVGGIVVILAGYGIIQLALTLICAEMIASLIAWSLFFRKIANPIQPVSLSQVVHLMRRSWRFALYESLQIAFVSLDVVLVSTIGGDTAAGYYGVAKRFGGAFSCIPRAISATMLPVLSRLYKNNYSRFLNTMREYARYHALLGAAFAGMMAGFAGDVIRILYGPDFIEAVPVLTVLGVSGFFSFSMWPFTNALISKDKETQALLLIGGAILLEVVLIVTLTPVLGSVAPALALMTGQILQFLITYFWANADIRRNVGITRYIWRFMLSGAGVIAVARYGMSIGLNLPLRITAVVLAFGICLVVTGAVGLREWQLGLRILRNPGKAASAGKSA